MKLANRIFLFFGALSVISFVQFDAMAKCTNTSGTFCKNKSNRNCRSGCYCTGSVSDVGDINVNNACDSPDSITDQQWSVLNSVGVNLCPKNFKHSASKSDSADDCYGICAGYIWIYNKKISCGAGKYLPKRGNSVDSCTVCTKGYYCPSVNVLPSCTQDQGRHECPDGYKNGPNGATKVTDCKNASGQNYVAPSGGGATPSGLLEVNLGSNSTVTCPAGQYLDINASNERRKCTDCSAGYVCPGDGKRYKASEYCGVAEHCPDGNVDKCISNEGRTGCRLCSGGRKANEDRTKCIFDATSATQIEPVQGEIPLARVVPGSNTGNGDDDDTGGGGGATYTVTYNCGNGGAGNDPVDPNSSYTSGHHVTALSADSCEVPSGKMFDRWSCNGTPVLPGYTFTITANTTCNATWEDVEPDACTTPGEYLDDGICKNCPKGYKCQNGQKVACTGNGYTDTEGQSACSTCNGTVITTEDGLNIGCTSNPACSYKVEFNKGNNAVSGSVAAITGKCQNDIVGIPPEPALDWANHTFTGWSCVYGNNNTPLTITNNSSITMPNANVTCTAQWDEDHTPVSCTRLGEYLDGEDCKECDSGYFCPGDGDEYKCPLSGTSTANKASCKVNVSKTKMGKCWKYSNNASDFRECVYDTRLESYLD